MKTINFVLGLGTAVILSALIGLGIAAFYQAPAAPNLIYPAGPMAQMAQYQAEQEAYHSAVQVYDRNLFIIANVIGVIVFVAGFFTVLNAGLAGQGVPVGIMLAGLWSIIYGYARGWGSIDDKLKFFIGLVIAVLVIGGSVWLLQRHAKRSGHRQ